MRPILIIAFIALIVGAVLLSAFLLRNPFLFSSSNPVDGFAKDDPFFVGVTYCGNSTAEAKLLIDRVKNFTNLFVLQSGSLMTNETAVNEIGNYTVSCGLHFAIFFETGRNVRPKAATWLDSAEKQWGDMFAGVYFGDEVGGKMLDTFVDLSENSTSVAIERLGFGGLKVGNTEYFLNGTIKVHERNGTLPDAFFLIPSFDHQFGVNLSYTGPDVFESNLTDTTITYYPNGSITVEDVFTSTLYYRNDSTHNTLREMHDYLFTLDNGSSRIAQVESYETVLSRNPIPDCDAAAEAFANMNRMSIDSLSNYWQLGNRSFPIFTADYALYWWDYQSGYDMVLAELGWNNTVAQEIGLVRGAATLQNKRWGTIITWTYDQPPYLANGNDMFEQLRMSYEAGAEYIVIFNYAEDMEGPFGTLEDEHFEALERFWNSVIQSPGVVHGGIKAQAAFVLPKNYGWGLRRADDTVWGLWEPTMEAKNAWPLLQEAIAKHGLRLDIVYDDSEHPFAGKYPKAYYWNQTS